MIYLMRLELQPVFHTRLLCHRKGVAEEQKRARRRAVKMIKGTESID